MTAKPIGLYVHIPICKRKCNYCDFCSYRESDADWREEYIDALCREIKSYQGKGIAVDTLFIGGGTPSLLSASELSLIIHCIDECFDLSDDLEFTLEANPGAINQNTLSEFVALGVNRLSIGLQSIHENEMKILGRIHSFEDFKELYRFARECGVKNINVDLMYGIPEQTIDSLNETLDEIIKLSPEHISLYGLILEEGTPFYEMKDRLPIPDEDTECDMYFLSANRLRAAGYSHYEISNYSRVGLECRHNLKYWRNQEYIGFGVAAYSYFEGKRSGNSRNISEYLSDCRTKYLKEETVDSENEAYEYVMLRLRLSEGFLLSDYFARFGKDFLMGREETVKRFVNAGYIKLCDGRISLTESGFYVSNTILTELI